MRRDWKQRAGCWLHERWKAEIILRAPSVARVLGWRWQDLCNRHERLERGDEESRVCAWEFSSLLTVCRLFPGVGGRLLRQAAAEYAFAGKGLQPPAPVSAVIPVRGDDRRASLESVVLALVRAAGPDSEVLVCEHDTKPLLDARLPAGSRHVFVPAATGEAFNKSKALNAGALAARHQVLLLHDADVWPPLGYVTTCLHLMSEEDCEAVHPIRFLFMLSQNDTEAVMRGRKIESVARVELVQQNNPGLSTFVRRETYYRIGGHDERFTSWGWEDVDFMDRLRTVRLHWGAFLPAVHLWHADSQEKRSDHSNRELLQRVRRESLAARIEAGRGVLDRNGWTETDRQSIAKDDLPEGQT